MANNKVISVDWHNFTHPKKTWGDIVVIAESKGYVAPVKNKVEDFGLEKYWKQGKLAKIHCQCAWCKKELPPKYSQKLEQDGDISHGICKPCAVKAIQDIDGIEVEDLNKKGRIE